MAFGATDGRTLYIGSQYTGASLMRIALPNQGLPIAFVEAPYYISSRAAEGSRLNSHSNSATSTTASAVVIFICLFVSLLF